MKLTYAILGLLFLGFLLAPTIFNAMKKKDFDGLYQGMQDAKIAGGAYQEDSRDTRSYADKLMAGD